MRSQTEDLNLRLRMRDLQVFILAIELGGMKKAAKQLGFSQPFITQTIRKLEEIFGVPLFERNRSGIEPTIYGRALFKRGLVALDELNQTLNDIQSLGDATTGEVRFSAPQGVGTAIFAEVVERFIGANRNASVDVSVETGLPESILKLRKRDTDFLIGALPKPLESSFEIDDLKIDRVADDEIILVVGKSHPLLKRKNVQPSDLVDQSWILPPKDEWYFGLLVQLFKRHHLVPRTPSVITSSAPIVAKLVRQNKYITIRSRLFARYHGLHELKCSLPSTKFSWSIVTIKGRTLSPIVERFINFSRVSLISAIQPMKLRR